MSFQNKRYIQINCMKKIIICATLLLALLPPISSAAEKIFLGDLKPMKAKVGFGGYYVITNGDCGTAEAKEFLVNGKPAQRGLFTHADSEIVFAIPQGARKFVAVGTMPNFQRASRGDFLDGSWSYEVIIDGVQVYESQPLCAYVKKQIPIEVEIPESAKQITLKTHMLGDANTDHSIWAEPYFIKP